MKEKTGSGDRRAFSARDFDLISRLDRASLARGNGREMRQPNARQQNRRVGGEKRE